jgi:hypothetical protein
MSFSLVLSSSRKKVSSEIVPIFKDTFTDVNDTNLINHTPDIDPSGGGWVSIFSGTAKIFNNKCVNRTINDAFYNVDMGVVDPDIRMDIVIYVAAPKVFNMYCQPHFTDSNNYWRAGAQPILGQWILFERRSGSSFTRQTVAKTFTNGESFSFQWYQVGDVISFRVDGVETLTWSTPSILNTIESHGFGMAAGGGPTPNSGESIDNYEVFIAT